MKKLIGIAAKARSGKDTVATYLWERHAFTRIAFADPMKMAAQAMFGLTSEVTWQDDMKETVIPYWGMSPRQIFQLLGTECVKPHFGNDIWIKRFMLTYSVVAETDDVIIPDVRFTAEADFIRAKGGRIIHLIRGDAPAYRILKMLVTNFEDTEAFKLGIIDAKGKNIRKANTLQTCTTPTLLLSTAEGRHLSRCRIRMVPGQLLSAMPAMSLSRGPELKRGAFVATTAS